MKKDFLIEHIKWHGKSLSVLDQQSLPNKIKWLKASKIEDVFCFIKNMHVRGAPLIGIVAALGLVVHLKSKKINNLSVLESVLREAKDILSKSRPTAVNLFWALDEIGKVVIENKSRDVRDLISLIEKRALSIWQEDIENSRSMGEYGAGLVSDGDGVLTHCNAGGLATGGYGTALAVMFKARERNINFRVYVDETRPVLQGARLTCWELNKAGIDYRLICDNMAGYLMSKGRINKIFVGADRIAKNGGFANKIGTYSLALLAKAHNIPFYVVAPMSSFDPGLETQCRIIIEQRGPEEVIRIGGKFIAPLGTEAENPAFDITPPDLIAAIICENGIIKPPFNLIK
ncbi:MAG: S-methyl-5-thioribose-1-phosphate isomerase [Candidatus Omnitrophica bacterium]|nr:S-methyl-5-thioribose-1-phosphate isomerase [Candidatus Omnitrophota bacterium]